MLFFKKNNAFLILIGNFYIKQAILIYKILILFNINQTSKTDESCYR